MGSRLSTTLVKDGYIITMDSDSRIIRGSVLIEDGEIRKVGKVDQENADKTIDAEDKIIIPGMVSGLARPARILLRAPPLKVEKPRDYIQRLRRIIWPFDEVLKKKDIEVATRAFCSKLVKSGVTFLPALHSSQGSIGKSLDAVAEAVKDVGIRALVGFEATERNTRAEGAKGMRENIRFLENLKGKRSTDSLVGGMVGLAPSFVVSDELLRHGKRVSNRFDAPIVISACKSGADSFSNLKDFGKFTVERLRDVGILSSNTVLANCVDISDEEIEMVGKAGAGISIDPVGNMRDGVGAAPIDKIKQRDISIGLGVDDESVNIFESMRFLDRVTKDLTGDLKAISPEEILRIVTIEGAALYGWDDRIGSLEPGKRGDLVIINSDSLPTSLRRDNVVQHVVKSVGVRDVETVIVGGHEVVKNHNIKTLNEKRAMNKCKETSKNVWKKFENTKR